MKRARIVGTGQFLPERVLKNDHFKQYYETSDEWIAKRTGIRQRHMADDGDGTSDLALEASKMALENAGMDSKELDIVICCTVTRDQIFPASGNLLQGKLGATNAASCDVNAACSGFLYGLATANAFIQTGLYKNALVVGAEKCTSLMTWNHRETDVLFGDGAGAVVLKAEEGDYGVLSIFLGSDGANHEILHLPKGGSREPFREDNMHDDPYKIVMNGQEVYKRAIVKFQESINVALEETGLTLDDIALFVPHQANVRIIEALCERIKFPREKTVVNMDMVGNTVAASIPLALHEANAQGRIKEGDYVLLAAFGAGLTWGSSIIRW